MILSIGEALVDLIADQPGPLRDAPSFTAFPGGAPANVAMAIAALGGVAAFAGSIGNDGFGDQVLAAFENSNVDVSRLVRSTEPTSVVVVSTGLDTPDFIPYRGADASFDVVPSLESITAVHTTAFALSREPQRATVLQTLGDAQQLGIPVSVDLNFSPVVWGVSEIEAHPILEQAVALSNFVKCSADDMARTFGLDWSIERLRSWGDAAIILTAGKHPTQIYTPLGETTVAVPPSEVVDPTGAGDAFWGGFLVSIAEGTDPVVAVTAGHRAAAAKLAKRGPLTDPVM